MVLLAALAPALALVLLAPVLLVLPLLLLLLLLLLPLLLSSLLALVPACFLLPQVRRRRHLHPLGVHLRSATLHIRRDIRDDESAHAVPPVPAN